jgi:ParB family chromosome partitioning protein
MTIKRAGDNEAYTSWRSDNLEQIIQDSYERFKESAEE